jgi:hypothetical protein
LSKRCALARSPAEAVERASIMRHAYHPES